ncbi:MAG TPA: hotdog family protein [Burkholderiaceae bacterium]|nr:hotdog family protein [Burkholderiaceae bacterium]
MTHESTSRVLDRDAIAALIPHAGTMCLLDRVHTWDAERIECHAISHRDGANPLREAGRLGAASGIEYAAQAMAVHGGLLAQANGGAPTMGFLASVRDVRAYAARLDDLAGDLIVEAKRLGGEASRVLYEFSVRTHERVVLEGRAAVVLDAESSSPPSSIRS